MADSLRSVFDLNHAIDPSDVATLAPDEISDLRAMAAGRRESPSRVRALDVYVRSGARDALSVIAEVLADPKEPLDVRASAAIVAARIPSRDAETVVQRALTLPQEPLVVTKLAAALGKIGTSESISVLERLGRDNIAFVRQQAEYALELIAHRERRQRRALFPAAEFAESRRKMVPFRVAPAPRKEIESVLHWTRHDHYSLEISPENAFVVYCGRSVFHILFDRRAWSDLSQRVTEEAMLLGLVSTRVEEDGSHAISRTIMTGPRGDGETYIAVHRSDGRMVQYGIATGERNGMGFGVKSLATTGNMILEVAGTLIDQRLTFTRTYTASERLPGQTPTRDTPQ